MLAQASGSVLEVAVGTGLNLPLYNASAIETYTGLDLSPEMLSQVTLQNSVNCRTALTSKSWKDDAWIFSPPEMYAFVVHGNLTK